MSTDNDKNPITVLNALDLVTKATNKHVEVNKFSRDFNDLINVPDFVVDVAQATDSDVADMLSDVFNE